MVTLKRAMWTILLWYWKVPQHELENLPSTGWGVHASTTDIHIRYKRLNLLSLTSDATHQTLTLHMAYQECSIVHVYPYFTYLLGSPGVANLPAHWKQQHPLSSPEGPRPWLWSMHIDFHLGYMNLSPHCWGTVNLRSLPLPYGSHPPHSRAIIPLLL